MTSRVRYYLLGTWLVLAIGYFALPLVFSGRASGPMLAMPVMVARDGALVRSKDVRSFKYQFAEAQTSFEPSSSVEEMRDAKVYGEGFLVDAPFTESREWMFGRTTISPQYRSLRIKVVFLDGTALSLAMPVISDTALNRPIRIDLQSAKAE